MKKITSTCIICFFFSLISLSQSTANYDISVTTIWNTTDHTSLPINAHWSALAGATHKNANDILEFGVTAPITNGIKDIAEIGNTANFMNEVNTAITAGNVDQYLEQSFSPFAGNNSNATINNVTISEDFPLITLVSMVAPSPDWFIAINSLNLRSGNDAINNGWKATFAMDVFAYDAGTDSGTDYTSGNLVSTPREPINMITGFPINGNKMATVTFTYNSSTLNINDLKPIETLKIYPNPTKGNITISNPENIEIRTVEVYNILGKLIKINDLNSISSKTKIDLTALNRGVYLLNIKDAEGRSNTKKLIIN